jgi:tRNA nucleotidyltransferase (CCA-adding enzyme)
MAFAMTAAITELDRIDPVEEVIINCEAPNDEILLIDWLNAIVYEMATRNLLFGEFKVSLQNHALRGLARGEPVNTSKHRPAVEVKGATYTALEVTQTDDGQWKAQCVIDV